MTKPLLAALTLLLLTGLARAQGAPDSATYDMACSNFHRNADGRWNATKPMTLTPGGKSIPLKPSTKFGPGTLFGGFDLAAALDKDCAK